MASDAEVAYWRERALFYERRLLALGESVDYPTPTAPDKACPTCGRVGAGRTIDGECPCGDRRLASLEDHRQLTVDDCIAEVERS